MSESNLSMITKCTVDKLLDNMKRSTIFLIRLFF